ncbi:MAG: cation:proton antiporter regulatory subunit [Syntrophomonadaceae bacterium]|jgi:TrkA domain protein|nr:cation:proton antiporter regulatory subunit [Syntrophomonadaceae bacterium]
MTNLREYDLPGVGKKFVLKTYSRQRLAVIIHHEGKRELYILDQEDEPIASVVLQDEEARQLGAVIGGAYYKPMAVESLEETLDQLKIEWYQVESATPLAGKSIAELDIRQRYGVSVVAVVRNQANFPHPPATFVFESGDTVAVLGKPDDLKGFYRLVRSGQRRNDG